MTTKHTPGPWTVSDNHGKRYIEPVGDNAPVAMIYRGHDDAYSANANLIAAAPELLAALEIADKFCGSLTADECPDYVHIPIREAIAKARGSQ